MNIEYRLFPLAVLLALSSFATFSKILDPLSLKGDSLVVKETEMTKILGYEGFVKDYKNIGEYDFYLSQRADNNVLFNNGKGMTPPEKLREQKFYCSDVIPFGKKGDKFFLQLDHATMGRVYFKLSGASKKFPFFSKEEYPIYLDQAIFIDTKMIGYVATLDYKYYYRSKRKSASYLSPYIRYQNIEFQGNGDKILYKKFGGGADIGKVFYFNEWLILDINIGLNVMSTGYDTKETDGVVDLELPKTLHSFGEWQYCPYAASSSFSFACAAFRNS